jgi:prepilin-type N-terminal cleavage/methylation domain-containing protein
MRPLPNDGERGLSLIELLAAIALFSIVVVSFVHLRNNAIVQASDANDLRILRYLAEYQIGELRLGYDAEKNKIETGDVGGNFENLGPDYEAYEWSAQIEELVAAGTSDDDEIPDLFQSDDEEDFEEADSEPGKPVTVIRITLVVRPVDAAEEDGVTIVTFKPAPPEEQEGGDGGG